MRLVNLIVIHCSASPNSNTLFSGLGSTLRTPLDEIDAWHKQRGFKRQQPIKWNARHTAVGYHFIVGRGGEVFSGRGPEEVGAHAQGFNAHSIGICLVGTDAYTVAQWHKLAAVVEEARKLHGVPLQPARRYPTPNPPGYMQVDGICGHRDLSPDLDGDGKVEPHEFIKRCPGFNVADWLAGGMQPLAGHIAEA